MQVQEFVVALSLALVEDKLSIERHLNDLGIVKAVYLAGIYAVIQYDSTCRHSLTVGFSRR